jgi:hypothetical protein
VAPGATGETKGNVKGRVRNHEAAG